jgi:5-methylcytosine-specific restriction endonuclease McrA
MERAQMIQSQLDTRLAFEAELLGIAPPNSREHRYVGGPPPLRIRRMQLAHETRARRLGLAYDLIDLRKVYAHHKGLCGICGEPVSLESFTIDHIIPVSRRGPHLFDNLQPAHRSCNSRKGDQ